MNVERDAPGRIKETGLMPDLVLLHGGQHGSWCWKFLLRALERQRVDVGRVICLDIPGCGRKRGRAVAALTLGDIVRELNGELRQQNVQQAVLLGHSIAGVLLPMMAVEDPALYSRLIHLATAVPEEGQSILQLLGMSVHGQNPAEVGWPLDPATAEPGAMLKAMFGADMSDEQFSWLLSEVAQDETPPALANEPATRAGCSKNMPSVYILTARDGILPPSWQRTFAQRLCCGEVIEIDTPHEPFVTDAELLATVLADCMIHIDQSANS